MASTAPKPSSSSAPSSPAATSRVLALPPAARTPTRPPLPTVSPPDQLTSKEPHPAQGRAALMYKPLIVSGDLLFQHKSTTRKRLPGIAGIFELPLIR